VTYLELFHGVVKARVNVRVAHQDFLLLEGWFFFHLILNRDKVTIAGKLSRSFSRVLNVDVELVFHKLLFLFMHVLVLR